MNCMSKCSEIFEDPIYLTQRSIIDQIQKMYDNGVYFCEYKRIFLNDKWYLIVDDFEHKRVYGPDYNFVFNKIDGSFYRWGVDHNDDPNFSPIGPEILDIEISQNGCPPVGNGGVCKFCYKGNTSAEPINMSFEDFKTILDKMPPTLTQIAFGITGIQTNPDFMKMIKYTREKDIIPNFTLSGADLTDDIASEVCKYIGAVAVSAYSADKNVCYNTVRKFIDLGINQTNIHIMVSDQTIDFVYEVLNDRMNDPRLSKMNAIVFLGVKPKGRAKGKFNSLSSTEYEKLIKFCLDKKINFGFDSCSFHKYRSAVEYMKNENSELYTKMIECAEPCESSVMSSYINCLGEYWHCSFTENEEGYKSLNVLTCDNFLNDIWYSPEVIKFRSKLLDNSNERKCHVHPSINN